MRSHLEKNWREWLIGLCCAMMLLLFWGTAVSTSWARIDALQTIEPYGFAVHEQLLFNFSHHSDFFQTVHLGYDDTWTWSGHRALTLPLNGLIYGLNPNPLWLSKIQITWVIFGTVPAAWLGRHATDSVWGLLLGAFFYLMSPALMALALQDHQDLVLATPCLMWTLCAMRARAAKWVVAGAIIGCLPREECVPLVVACAIVSFPGSRRLWLRNIGIAIGIAVVYTVVVNALYPLAPSQHDMPLVNAIKQVLRWPPQVFLDGWPYLGEFYSLLWAPIGLIALFSPSLLLPGLGLVFLHMTVPWGHGVDRSWGGHVHHMGPALPFFTAAAIFGAARVIRLMQRVPLHASRLVTVVCILLGTYALNWNQNWASYYKLRTAIGPTPPTYTHPAWTLVREHLTQEDAPIIGTELALAVSSRTRSYTFDESLQDKAPGRGLAAGTHLIVDHRNTEIYEWGMAMTGATEVAKEGPFVLITWAPGALDQNIPASIPGMKRGLPTWPGMPRDRTVIDGVPPRTTPPPPPVSSTEPQAHQGPGRAPNAGPAPVRAPQRP